MARRVARAVAHIQGAIANLYCVAIGQPAVGCERFTQWKVEHATLVGQAINPELVAFVRPDDGQVQFCRQLGHATGMVDVRMGQPNGLQFKASVRDCFGEPIKIAAGVDDCGLVGFTAPHD